MEKLLSLEKEEDFLDVICKPEVFAEVIVGIRPFHYQRDFLRDDSKRIVFKSGRQVGKTTITAIKALHRAFSRPNEQILILSATQRQASLMFNIILEIINKSPCLASKVQRQTLTIIYFKNRSNIHCLPGGRTGFTVRGFSPTLIIVDEAAFVPDEVFIAVEPSLASHDGDLILLSTPFGKRGRFYRAYYDENFTQYSVKSSECPLVSKEFLEFQKSSMSELEYLQEFEGEFVEEVDVFFPRELIMSCLDFKEEQK